MINEVCAGKRRKNDIPHHHAGEFDVDVDVDVVVVMRRLRSAHATHPCVRRPAQPSRKLHGR